MAKDMSWNIYIVASMLGLISLTAKADILSAELLKSANPEATYLFYLHGQDVDERRRSSEESFRAVTDALNEAGFVVATEIRPEKSVRKFPEDHQKYAKHVAKSVKKLMRKGVPASSIIVAGYSRGGILALVSSGFINNSDIGYVVMAGCPTADGAYQEAVPLIHKKFSPKLRGRFLSMIDKHDKNFGSCEDYFILSTKHVDAQEITLKTGQGHQAFLEPRRAWLHPLKDWAGLR